MPAHALDNDAAILSKARSVINSQINSNITINNDSALIWEKQLEPELIRLKEYRLLFQLKHVIASIYSTRGDINIAVDYTRKMYETAQRMNCSTGIALANHAIGDAYLHANMQRDAIEAYKEALLVMEKVNNSADLELRVLPSLILTLLKIEHTKEADKYINQLSDLYKKAPTRLNKFPYSICKAYYFIVTKKQAQATEFLAKAEEEYHTFPTPLRHAVLTYVQANYYENNQEYDCALNKYEELIAHSGKHLPAYKYIQIKREAAGTLAKMGKMEEASLLYKKLHMLKDSVDAQCYIRQINELHATYQIDQMDIQNQKQRNKITLWIIIAIILIVLLTGILICRFKKENRCLLQSQEKQDRARKIAESSIQTKSLFLSNMSHEIRTPLNALSGFSSILTDPLIDNETRKQCNDIIQQNSDLLLKLINDVIDLSSLEVGKLALHMEKCDAVSICRNVVDTVEKVKQTQAGITFNTSLEALPLVTDASRLQQVLINLLINATKFTTQGTITLELKKESEEMVSFSVTDTGCGIPPEKQNQIFNRFEKLNEGAQGTGLGLSICQLIIHQIGGEIWIDPTYTNGARFCFTHPIGHPDRKESIQ